jgi:tripartite-type tricarboxylate transporter receptor subunit TctC
MMCTRRRWLIGAIVCGSCLAAISMEALAQAYPTRPVQLVIPYAPGGPTDILGRTVAQKLGEILREQFVVENRPGAATIIGTASVAKAAADGYTLLLGDITGFGINPSFYKSLPYNARTDFTPIGPVATGAMFLFVGTSFPARTIQELIALAKSKPGELSFGSAGTGQFGTHIGPELFKLKNGLNMLHVPYKGAAPAMIDVAAGRVSFMMTAGLAVAKPFLVSGKIRALAITGEKRSPALPEVPTFAEAGSPLPEMNAGAWFGLLGPPGLPRSIVVKLNESTVQAMAAPDVLGRLAALDLDPKTGTPEEFASMINAAIETWGPLLQRANIKAE